MKWLQKRIKAALLSLSGIKTSTWRTLALMFVLYVLPVVLFVKLADEVLEHDTLDFDVAVLEAVRSLAQPWLDPIIVALTNIGGVVGTVVIAGLFTLWLLGHWRRTDFVLLLSGLGGAVVINALLKLLFQRDRPMLWERIVTENTYSFPSGHAMASMALALCVIIILWPTKWRWLVTALGALYVVTIGFTRMYLGVHYPTDIVAGWLVSIVWVTLVSSYLIKWRRRSYTLS